MIEFTYRFKVLIIFYAATRYFFSNIVEGVWSYYCSKTLTTQFKHTKISLVAKLKWLPYNDQDTYLRH